VEDCLNQVDNSFQLIHLAAKRVRQLKRGEEPVVRCKNKDIVVALREIAAGDVFQAGKAEENDRIEPQPELEMEKSLPESIEEAPEPEMETPEEVGEEK